MDKESTQDKKVFFQARLDENLIDGIKMMAMHHKMNIKDYLNNFFKEFLLLQAESLNDQYLVGSLKQKLDKVKHL